MSKDRRISLLQYFGKYLLDEFLLFSKKRIMRSIFTFLIIAGLLLHGCEKDETNCFPGNLELHFISFHESTSHEYSQIASQQEINCNDGSEYFLDTIKSSRTFYFIIGNNGQSEITDVTVTTDNENFIVAPTHIPLIPGANRDMLLNQVFSLDVLHGTRINGIGSAKFLNKGDNICNLSIKGKASYGRSSTSVSLNVRIKIYAELMSISLFQGRFEYDLNTRDVLMSGFGTYPIDEMKMFYYFTINPPVTIKNTGNVDIKMTLMSFDTGNPITQTAMIQPNDTLNLLLPIRESEYRDGGMIRLDSKGTVFDINKLNLGKDGAAYFALQYPSDFWFANHTPPNRIY